MVHEGVRPMAGMWTVEETNKYGTNVDCRRESKRVTDGEADMRVIRRYSSRCLSDSE